MYINIISINPHNLKISDNDCTATPPQSNVTLILTNFIQRQGLVFTLSAHSEHLVVGFIMISKWFLQIFINEK